MHIEFLLEEEFAEKALEVLVPKIVGANATFRFHPFQGKTDLLQNLEPRLRGYSSWVPDDWFIVVLMDRDQQDCHDLKSMLERAALRAGLTTRSAETASSRVLCVNRLAIEELEAWFFGDVAAIVAAYPRVSPHLANQAAYRDSDAIAGGTWEALERVLQRKGYYGAGIPKGESARRIADHMDPDRNRSRSFQVFKDALRSIVS